MSSAHEIMEIAGLLSFFVLIGVFGYVGKRLRLQKDRLGCSIKIDQQKDEQRKRQENAETLIIEKEARANFVSQWVEQELAEWEEYGICLIIQHKNDLRLERERFAKQGPYGAIDKSNWIDEGIPVFVESVLLPSLAEYLCEKYRVDDIDDITAYKDNDWNVYDTSAEFSGACPDWICPDDYYFVPSLGLEEALCDWAQSKVDILLGQIQSDHAIDGATGKEYEFFCRDILEGAGWKVRLTPVTGDQGVDLIASLGSYRVCIQCKRFSSAVGNSAVQEVVAGRIHWGGSHSVVVTNSGFTRSARQLASSANVLLLHHSELSNLENTLMRL